MGNSSEHHSKQLFKQRPPASDTIDRMEQVNRFILPLFLCLPAVMLPLCATVVSSSEAGGSI